MTKETSNAYYLYFSYDIAQPGTIIVHGDDEQSAVENFKTMMEERGIRNLEVLSATTLDKIPELEQFLVEDESSDSKDEDNKVH